mgnify:CR=1 FL=1
MARIGIISVGTDPSRPGPQWSAFAEMLRGLGYAEGRNIAIERRFAAGKSEKLPGFAAELVRLDVDVIVVSGPPEVEAARGATTTIPIVTIEAPDLVARGLIASLARPGGNITGLTLGAPGTGEKYVELLREAAPSDHAYGGSHHQAARSGRSRGDAGQGQGAERGAAGTGVPAWSGRIRCGGRQGEA